MRILLVCTHCGKRSDFKELDQEPNRPKDYELLAKEQNWEFLFDETSMHYYPYCSKECVDAEKSKRNFIESSFE